MIALCATFVLLAAAPEVAVVQRSTEGVSPEVVAKVLRQISDGLKNEGFSPRTLSKSCVDAKCLSDTSLSEKVAATVGVTIIRGRRDLTLDLEAIDGQQRQLAINTFGVPFKGAPLPLECAEFFRNLKLELAPKNAAIDVPRVVQLEPDPKIEEAPELVEPKPARGLVRAAAVTTIVTGAAGVGLLIASAVVKIRLDGIWAKRDGSVITEISRGEAERQAQLSNSLGTGSIVALAVTGVAAVATGVLWLTDAPAAPVSEE
jgi:hypothetical protein